MARVFIALKLRLLRNRLSRGGLVAALGFLVIWLSSLAAGLGLASIMSVVARLAPESLGAAVVLAHAGVGLLWLIVPVILASLDDSFDARNFESFPIDDRRLAAGMLAAGLAGPGGLATTVGLAYGSVLAYGTPALIVPLLVVEAVAVVLCVAVARWVTTRLSDLLRRRRGQEVAMLVVIAIATLPSVIAVTVAPTVGTGASVRAVLDRAAGVVQWTPWGALGRAVVAMGNGDWLPAAGFSAIGVACAVAAFLLFSRALRRLTVVAPANPVARVGRRGSALYPVRVPLPASPTGAVAAKELISMRRDVRMRSQMLGGGVAVVVLGAAGGSVVLGTNYAPFLAVLAVFIVVNAVTPNQLGYEGRSFWAYLVSVPDLGPVIRGKNLAWAVLGVPIAAVTAVGAAAASGNWVYVPAALESAVAVGLIWLGVTDVTSVFGAFRLPDTNLFANRTLSGAALVATMVGLAASGVATLPVVAAVGVPALLDSPGWATLAATLSVPYGVWVYRLTAGKAIELADRRRFRLLETLDEK